MRTISEVEKRLQCEAQFSSILSLESQIPDDGAADEKEESIEDWIRINIGEEYLNLDKKFD